MAILKAISQKGSSEVCTKTPERSSNKLVQCSEECVGEHFSMNANTTHHQNNRTPSILVVKAYIFRDVSHLPGLGSLSRFIGEWMGLSEPK